VECPAAASLRFDLRLDVRDTGIIVPGALRMLKRVWRVSLAILVAAAVQAGAAMAWEIEVRNEGGYPARAVEGGVQQIIDYTRIRWERDVWAPIGAATEQFRSGVRTLYVSDDKESVLVIGYIWDDDRLEPEEIARYEIRKDDATRCVAFRGWRPAPVFQRC